MRCYGLQGRVQQVARQFELCRKALRDGIAASPLPVTVDVYRAARAQAMEHRSSDWGHSSPIAAA